VKAFPVLLTAPLEVVLSPQLMVTVYESPGVPVYVATTTLVSATPSAAEMLEPVTPLTTAFAGAVVTMTPATEQVSNGLRENRLHKNLQRAPAD